MSFQLPPSSAVSLNSSLFRLGRGGGSRPAEQECLSEADARAAARERAAVKRAELDADYVENFATRIAELYPAFPEDERRTIAEHACQKYSGRVGRSAAAKALDHAPVDLAVRAHVRHVHTLYDRLLGQRRDRSQARAEIRDDLEQVLARWGGLEPASG